MNDWVVIQSFERIYQAELSKDILEKNGIESVVVNEKDSLFLFGNIELYVGRQNEKKAKALIDEFNGLTKINSFIDIKPILLFQKILQKEGINTILKRKEHNEFILDNYELYVRNIDLNKTIPFLTGEKLIGWNKVKTCRKVRQTKFYIEILNENLINSIVIKKKNSEYHLEEIYIYTENENSEKAIKMLEELKGFAKIREEDKYSIIETQEEILANKGIKAITIKTEQGGYELLVNKNKLDEADSILNINTEWSKSMTFNNIANAVYYRNTLEEENIPAVIVNEQDSSFMFGDIELHVENKNLEKASKIFNELKNNNL